MHASNLIDLIHSKYGKIGILAVDQTICGRCCGGVRIFYNEIPVDEIKQLAKSMTLKLGFLKIDPRGGCKLGLLIPAGNKYNRKEIFLGLGKFLKDILRNGSLSIGVDLGTNEEDINLVYKGAGFKNFSMPMPGSSYYTAKSIFIAIDVTREIMYFKNDMLNIGIEGFGKVGSEIARMAIHNNCRVIAISNKYRGLYNPKGLNISKIMKLYCKYGDGFILEYNNDKQINKDDLFGISNMHILIPCADTYALSTMVANNIEASAVIPASNLSADECTRRTLFNRNIFYVPDFIANSGGTLGSFLVSMGMSLTKMDNIFSNNLKEKMLECLNGARKITEEPFSYSQNLAMRNFFDMKSQYENSSKGKLLSNRFFHYIKRKPIINKLIRNYIINRLEHREQICI